MISGALALQVLRGGSPSSLPSSRFWARFPGDNMMRFFLASLAVLLLACALAHADEIADEADVLRMQLAESRADALAARIEAAKAELHRLLDDAAAQRSTLQKKYKLDAGDQIDPSTRAIKRAPKKEAKK
jgi:hypothetical protein